MPIQIAPSLLAADLGCLREEIARAAEGGCDVFHIDIMDFHFVPNLSFGPNFVAAVRRMTDLPLDVHLMVDNPLDMIGAFADAGSDCLTLHVETIGESSAAFDAIDRCGIGKGISLRPDTPVERIFPWLGAMDLVLVMSVYPGFGGQSFLEDTYDRIRAISREAAQCTGIPVISVDGGVDGDNACGLTRAGANRLVAGTSVFRDHQARENIRRLREAAANSRGASE